MENNHLREKVHLVWGAVFMTAFSGWALTMAIFSGGTQARDVLPIAVAFTVGALISLVTVPLLLSVPGSSPALLAGGRILLWLQAISMGVGCVLGIIIMVT